LVNEAQKLEILARKSALWSLAGMHVVLGFLIWPLVRSDNPSEYVARALDSVLFSIASLIGILLFGRAALNLSNRFGTAGIAAARTEETTTVTKTVEPAAPAGPHGEVKHD
jgi:hypothetical protein